MYLPVFPDLLATLYFMPRPRDVAMVLLVIVCFLEAEVR